MTTIEQVASDVAERFEPFVRATRATDNSAINDKHIPVFITVLHVLREAESRELVVFRDTSADFLFKGRG